MEQQDRHHAHEANEKNLRRVMIALVLTGTFMIVEVVGGVISGSLALLADAGHMLTDSMALALAAIGVYGLMAFSTEERVGEVGIRRALGGGTSTILRTVLRKAVLLAGAGVAVGTIGALGLSRLVRGMLFGVEALDPFTFLGAGAVVIGMAIAAALLPAYRATRVDPLVTLSWGRR